MSEYDYWERLDITGAVLIAPTRVADLNPTVVGAVLVVYITLLPIQIQLSPRFLLAPSDIVLVIALAMNARRLRAPGHLISFWHGALAMLLAGIGVVTVFGSGAISTWGLVNKTLGFFVLLGVYLLVGEFANSFGRILRVLHVFVALPALYNVIAIAFFLLDIRSVVFNSAADLDRLAGGLIDPNAYGGLLVVCLVGYLGFRWESVRLFTPAMDVLILVSLIAGIVLTYSRTAWLGLIVGSVGLIILNRKSRRALGVALLLGATIALFALAVGSGSRAAELSTRSATITDRLALNEAAIDQITLNPLGMGIGGFQEQYGAIVHNTFLWFGADLGVVGLVVFSGFVMWVLRRLLLAYRAYSGPERSVVVGLGMAYLSVLTLSMAIEAFYQRYWWVVMGLIAAAASPNLTITDREPEST